MGSTVGSQRRSCKTASLVLGVAARFQRRGIASGLLHALEEWARTTGLHRLELTVMTHNHRALRLYEKEGFVVEGTRREALLVGGAFVNEHYMAKLLAP